MTIYALSSGPGISGVAVIRISGPDTKKIISNNSRIKNFLKWSPPKNPLRLIVKSCINWEKKISKQY